MEDETRMRNVGRCRKGCMNVVFVVCFCYVPMIGTSRGDRHLQLCLDWLDVISLGIVCLQFPVCKAVDNGSVIPYVVFVTSL